MPTLMIDGTGEPPSFYILGFQCGWSSARLGKVLQMILREKCAGPIAIARRSECW